MFYKKRPVTLLKKKLSRRCFPVNFAKFLRTSFLQNTSGQLLLKETFPLIPENKSWSASPVAVLIKHPSLGLFCKVTALHCINVSVFRVILVRIFPAFSHIRTEYGEIISPYSVRMRENVGKMWTRITPNTDTFYAVLWLKTLL